MINKPLYRVSENLKAGDYVTIKDGAVLKPGDIEKPLYVAGENLKAGETVTNAFRHYVLLKPETIEKQEQEPGYLDATDGTAYFCRHAMGNGVWEYTDYTEDGTSLSRGLSWGENEQQPAQPSHHKRKMWHLFGAKR